MKKREREREREREKRERERNERRKSERGRERAFEHRNDLSFSAFVLLSSSSFHCLSCHFHEGAWGDVSRSTVV